MLILTGKNLGERQHDFNNKVIQAANEETDIDQITPEEQQDDIVELFKIDLASRYKNLDYILDTLKSGDSLYVTRALKCTWIYDDTYANIINPSYLHHKLFPYMSQRMKLKMLTKISIHVRNGDRAICFYSYCINARLNNIALKFVIYTPESFKTNLITNDEYFNETFYDGKYLKQLVGNSLALAAAYVEMHLENYRSDVIHELRYLYFMFEKDYLDMLERYVQVDAGRANSLQRLGIRISRDILKKHKVRVWKNPLLYINKLNKSMLTKYLKIEDVKELAKLLLPTTSNCFWSMDFYHSYECILNLIPSTMRFAYLKNIFSNKYEGEPFEMYEKFYYLKYYKLLTIEEQESWALQHIEREEELWAYHELFVSDSIPVLFSLGS